MDRYLTLTVEEDELLECCQHALMKNVDDEYYYFERSILEKFIRYYSFELIKTTNYYRKHNEILSGLVKKKGDTYEFLVDIDTGEISIEERNIMDSKKLNKDSKESEYDYIDYLKKYISNLNNSKKKLQNQIDIINDKIAELKGELEKKEGYASLEERDIDY